MLGLALLAGGCGPDDDGCRSGCPDGTCAAGVFAPICPGEFGMGGQHRPVTLTRGFEILSTEVTQAGFEDLMGYNPSTFTADHERPCGAECPVETLTWHEAAAYCNALSDEAGLEQCYVCAGEGATLQCERNSSHATPYDCSGYRLPTSAEWEYAARAGTTTRTYNGDFDFVPDDCDRMAALMGIAWYCGSFDGESSPSPVARLRANPWGLFDVLGNVREMASDSYCDDYSGEECTFTGTDSTDPVIDPFAEEDTGVFVVRGGSWTDEAAECTSTAVIRIPTDSGQDITGFRPVRTRFDVGANE